MHVFVSRSAYIDGKSVNGFHHKTNRAEFIVVSIEAPPSTLAHGFGHALGLDHVEDDKTNIMCACRDHADTTGFTALQGRRMQFHARSFLARSWGSI